MVSLLDLTLNNTIETGRVFSLTRETVAVRDKRSASLSFSHSLLLTTSRRYFALIFT